jgi:hypothetical protein
MVIPKTGLGTITRPSELQTSQTSTCSMELCSSLSPPPFCQEGTFWKTTSCLKVTSSNRSSACQFSKLHAEIFEQKAPEAYFP